MHTHIRDCMCLTGIHVYVYLSPPLCHLWRCNEMEQVSRIVTLVVPLRLRYKGKGQSSVTWALSELSWSFWALSSGCWGPKADVLITRWATWIREFRHGPYKLGYEILLTALAFLQSLSLDKGFHRGRRGKGTRNVQSCWSDGWLGCYAGAPPIFEIFASGV